MLSAEAPQVDVVLDALDRHGWTMCCRVRISPLLYGIQALRGAVLIVEDVTEERREREYTRYLGHIVGQLRNEVYFLDPATLR